MQDISQNTEQLGLIGTHQTPTHILIVALAEA